MMHRKYRHVSYFDHQYRMREKSSFQLMNANLIFWRANNEVKKHGIDFGG